LGTKVVLAEPWSFDLFYESRNDKLIDTLGLRKRSETNQWSWDWADGINKNIQYGTIIKRVTLPRGSKLSVSRIYIRNGVSAYNSVTFTLIKVRKKKGEPQPPHGRFWAKLYDVNQIVCYPIGNDPEVNAVWTKPEVTHLKTFRFLDVNDTLE
jgi:hypothetical protein